MRKYARSQRKLAKSARASENLRAARRRDGREDANCDKLSLTNSTPFAFMCAHAIILLRQ